MKGFENPRGRASKRGTRGPTLKLMLDPKAYFRAFCEVHGGFPMEDRGRLLFADGWTYSATSYEGPEWAPPEDPQASYQLQLRYWIARKKLVTRELAARTQAIEDLEVAQRGLSAPMQQTWNAKVYDEELGREVVKRFSGPVNLKDLRLGLREVVRDAEESAVKIKELVLELRLLRLKPTLQESEQ